MNGTELIHEVKFAPFPKQMELMKAALSGKYRYLLYGGGIRGGKTFLMLALIFILCKLYPGSRWAVVRKDLPTIRRNVLPAFEKLAPRPFVGQVNKTEWTATCTNGSQIIFFPENYDKDKELNRWRGLEVNGFLLEEANELAEASFDKAIERAGAWIIRDGKQPLPLVLLTCNPGNHWIKTRFYTPSITGKLKAPFYFLQALISDNPHIPAAYLESLKNMPAEIYEQFVKGNWDVVDDPRQIIPYSALHSRLVQPDDAETIAMLMREFNLEPEALGVDVADAGDDDSTLAYARGAFLYEVEVAPDGTNTAALADLIKIRALERSIRPDRIGIDAVGVGAGTYNDLLHAGFDGVRRIIAGGRPTEEFEAAKQTLAFQYRNLKTQMWWEFRLACTTPESPFRIIHDPALVQELLSVRYDVVGDKVISVEESKHTRKRLNRSPDKAAAAVILNHVRLQEPILPAIFEEHEFGIEPDPEEGFTSSDIDTTWSQLWNQ